MNTPDCDEVYGLLEELKEYAGEPVIVEGRKDREALESLGFSNVIQLHSGSQIYEIVEMLQGCSHRKIAILTDFDSKGIELRKRILEYFSQYGLTENKEPRRILVQMNIRFVENLSNLEI